jgi:hypothetical protein
MHVYICIYVNAGVSHGAVVYAYMYAHSICMYVHAYAVVYAYMYAHSICMYVHAYMYMQE